jgi:hypothetical protein
MLRRLIFLLMLSLVATQAISLGGPLSCGKKAVWVVLAAGAADSTSAIDSASPQELPGDGLAHRGKSHCLVGLGISRADAVADRGGESNEVHWTDLQSSPTGLHLPPAHPPPVSAA